jgi:hypothetical protein
MKPKEFDELIRRKFEQNDFGYNPRNWDSLVEQMDGRSKKRSMMMWWLMPLAGVAASVALAVGVSPIMQWRDMRSAHATPHAKHATHHSIAATTSPAQAGNSAGLNTVADHTDNTTAAGDNNTNAKKQHTAITQTAPERFAINLDAAIGNNSGAHTKKSNFNLNSAVLQVKKENENKNALADKEGIHTFKPEAEIKKPSTFSVIISGGINHGSQSSGYAAGATVRKMINDKVYIESDVAFATSTQTTAQYGYSMQVSGSSAAARPAAAARTTSTTTDGKAAPPIAPVWESFETTPQTYSLNYVQVTPSIGCKVMKKMSVGVGPDFQQMLADNRPAVNSYVTDNVKVAPTFDIGFVGKTEYNVTKTVKAAVSYRKGVNNILTPTDKYLDRDYLQFQVRCAIFNK